MCTDSRTDAHKVAQFFSICCCYFRFAAQSCFPFKMTDVQSEGSCIVCITISTCCTPWVYCHENPSMSCYAWSCWYTLLLYTLHTLVWIYEVMKYEVLLIWLLYILSCEWIYCWLIFVRSSNMFQLNVYLWNRLWQHRLDEWNHFLKWCRVKI